MEKSQASWMCLKGNPRVYTNFATRLGYPTLLYRFYDVYALDSEVWRRTIPEPSPLFIKQNIANACGVISLLHALSNTVDRCGGPIEGSYLDKFMKVNKNSSPEEQGATLSVEELNPEELSNAISSLHEVNQEFVSQSDAQPKADQPPGHFQLSNLQPTLRKFINFVCYMEKNGCIWELDGIIKTPKPFQQFD